MRLLGGALALILGLAALGAAALPVSASVAPRAPTVGPAIAPPTALLSPNVAFVSAAFQVVLHRPADQAALAQFPPLLAGGKLSQTQLVQQLMNSTEFRGNEVNALYQHFLGRAADAASNALIGLLNQGGTVAQVAAVLAASQEYYAKAGGTNAGFISKLYSDALGRAPSNLEVQQWLAMFAQGASRTQVATTILQSAEGSNHLLLVLYQGAMQRTGTPTGSTLLAAALAAINQVLGVR